MRRHPLLPRIRRSLVDRYFMFTHRLPASDSLLFKLALLVFVASSVWFLVNMSSEKSSEVPAGGGMFTEGIVGTPRFLNPVLAVTRADKDLTALIYSGLMRLSADGALVPDIAESVTVAEDGVTYNVQLRQDVLFHDGTPVTAEDISFTIASIQDPALASPFRANFDGVFVEQLGTHELNFVLPEPYAPFIENLTVGIIPRHIWKDATAEEFPFSQHNSEPVGAGPYKVSNIKRNTSGIPQSYELAPHDSFHRGVAQISDIVLNFYSNESRLIAAFNKGEVDSASGISTDNLNQLTIDENTHTLTATPLPRTFALFFNQNKSAALRDNSARKALDAAIDKDALIGAVLSGYGTSLYGPIPPGFGVEPSVDPFVSSSSDPLDVAREMLSENGWTINEETNIWEKEIDDVMTPLAISISTANNPVFEATAEFIRASWEQLGVAVTIRQFEQADLTQGIIRPREYEVLLFGTVIGRSLDFYSFWHSSQRNDPGLNVALYANITTDSILVEARTNASSSLRAEAFARFANELATEQPAIFLYSPQLIYIHPTAVTGLSLQGVAEAHERFASVNEWYIDTEAVWPIFNQN